MSKFNQLIATIKRSKTAIRANIQKAVVIALETFESNGDTQQLTTLMQACRGGGLSARTLQDFIQHHANVSWRTITAKDKTKQQVFKKVGKDVQVKEVTTQWYLFNNKGEPVVKPLDFEAQAKAFITRVSKALAGEDGKSIKAGQEDKARQAMDTLQGMIA